MTELTDEIELLKLRLDIAEQEKCEAAQRAAEAHALLTHSQQAADRASGDATPSRQRLPGVAKAGHTDVSWAKEGWADGGRLGVAAGRQDACACATGFCPCAAAAALCCPAV